MGASINLPRTKLLIIIIAIIGITIAGVALNSMRTEKENGKIAVPAGNSAERLLARAVQEMMQGNPSGAQEATDKLLQLNPKRDVRADAEQAPQIKAALYRSWSRANRIIPLSLIESTSNLGPGFEGSDLDVLVAQLAAASERVIDGRREAETMEEYEARHSAELAKPRTIGPYTATEEAFVIVPKGVLYLGYDPNMQSFRWGSYTYSGKFDIKTGFGDEPELFSRKETDAGSYVGQNAYGAQVRVQKKEILENQIAITNAEQFEWSKMSIPVPREQVAELKPHLRVLLAIVPTEPLVGHLIDRKKPTFSNPVETEHNIDYVCGELQEFRVYRNDTGEVLARLERILPAAKSKKLSDYWQHNYACR